MNKYVCASWTRTCKTMQRLVYLIKERSENLKNFKFLIHRRTTRMVLEYSRNAGNQWYLLKTRKNKATGSHDSCFMKLAHSVFLTGGRGYEYHGRMVEAMNIMLKISAQSGLLISDHIWHVYF